MTMGMSLDGIMPPIRRAASAAAALPQSGRDRRRFFRVNVTLNGRLLARDGQEYPCVALDASPGSIRISTMAPLGMGDPIVIYCDDIGRLIGQVARIAPDGSFGITLDVTPHKREKLAETLMWVINGRDGTAIETRRWPRTPTQGSVGCELENGRCFEVEMLDVSVVGASFTTTERPLIGAWIKVGQQVGRVARYLDGGIAVDFSPRAAPGSKDPRIPD
jgi:hypothetical protein